MEPRFDWCLEGLLNGFPPNKLAVFFQVCFSIVQTRYPKELEKHHPIGRTDILTRLAQLPPRKSTKMT